MEFWEIRVTDLKSTRERSSTRNFKRELREHLWYPSSRVVMTFRLSTWRRRGQVQERMLCNWSFPAIRRSLAVACERNLIRNPCTLVLACVLRNPKGTSPGNKREGFSVHFGPTANHLNTTRSQFRLHNWEAGFQTSV